jgi:SGNH domain-containing protein
MRGRPRRARRSALLAAVAVTALSLPVTVGAASTPPPPPGTAAEIYELVHAAPTITTLPANAYPTLTAEYSDSASHEFPATNHGCLVIGACVFGDTTATRTIVLFGDSHAQMWLSAVAPIAATLKYRVELLYLGGCPEATVTVWNPLPLPPFPAGYYHGCDQFRTREIRAINHLHPALVLLSNRTAMVESGSGTYFTNAQWEHGLGTTILALKQPGTRVAVIGDINYFNQPMPQCLAANPSNVQQCASPNPNPTAHGHQSAEHIEATKLHVPFINVLPWICTTTCSGVIGGFLPYLNSTHLDATYITFLTNVLQTALVKVLK